MIGPLEVIPFEGQSAVSPLNSVAKKDTDKRRVIVDLSFPEAKSVNDGIRAEKYLNYEEKLTFPSVQNLVNIIHKKGKGCYLFKRDLSRYYRQLPVDPGDIHLLGVWFEGQFYFDLMVPMGLVSSARIAQMVSDVITYVFSLKGFDAVNYIDDLGGAEVKHKAWEAFFTLGQILNDMGLKEAAEKATPPSTCMTFLGLEVNTISMTITIPSNKMIEINIELDKWLEARKMTKRKVQRLAGLLNFASACIRPGRIYLARILNFLRSFPVRSEGEHVMDVDPEVLEDVKWWKGTAQFFNGISLILEPNWSKPDACFSSDACLTGCGALTDGRYFHAEFPERVKNTYTDINQLEFLTIIVVLKVWGELFHRSKILIYCDNLNTVRAINSGSSRDRIMQQLLRNMHALITWYSIDIWCIHLNSTDNRKADLLSRWHLNPSNERMFKNLMGKVNCREYRITNKDFELMLP